MIRKLLATTALTAVLAGGAYAQATTENETGIENQNQTEMQTQTDVQNQDAGQGFFDPEYQAPEVRADGYFSASADQILASSLMGQTIYSSNADDAEAVGDVNDVVITPDGRARAVVVGVGGFLGIGEKEVAIDFSQLSWSDNPETGERRLTASVTAEELESAQAFDRSVFDPQPVAGMEGDATLEGDATMNDGATMNEGTDGTAMDGGTMTGDGLEQNMQDDQADQGIVDENATTGVDANADVNADANADAGAAATDDTMQDRATDNDAGMTTMDSRENMTAVDAGTISADELIGARVYGSNDTDIGEIGDVILSADDQVEAYIVDVGGFLGIGAKPVALAAAELEIFRDQNGGLNVYTSFTEDQLNSQPEYTEDTYTPDTLLR